MLKELILTAIDGSYGHQNTSSASKCTHQISSDTQNTEDSTTKSCGRWDNSLELLVHALFTMSSHHHLLFL